MAVAQGVCEPDFIMLGTISNESITRFLMILGYSNSVNTYMSVTGESYTVVVD